MAGIEVVRLLDDVRAAADRVAGREKDKPVNGEWFRQEAAAERQVFGDVARVAMSDAREGDVRRVLAPLGGRPMRWISRSCSACNSVSAGDGSTVATIACGFLVPSAPMPVIFTGKAPRRTRHRLSATASASTMSMSPMKRRVR